MSSDPSFLPERIDTDGEWQTVCDALYEVYSADFRRGRLTHGGKIVFRDRRVLPDGDNKEEGFWHLVTCDDRSVGDRVFDSRRACRLPWVRPLIAEGKRDEIITFDHEESNRRLRRYIWLQDHDFVVILEHKGERYFLVTAFCVDYARKRRQLESRARKAGE